MVHRERGRGCRKQASNLRRVKGIKSDGRVTNTERRNQTVLRDMEFWFLLIEDKILLEVARGKVPLVKNLAEFWKLNTQSNKRIYWLGKRFLVFRNVFFRSM